MFGECKVYRAIKNYHTTFVKKQHTINIFSKQLPATNINVIKQKISCLNNLYENTFLTFFSVFSIIRSIK